MVGTDGTTEYERARTCPSCDSDNSEVADVHWNGQTVEQDVLCNECPTEWRIVYRNPKQEGVRFHGDRDGA